MIRCEKYLKIIRQDYRHGYLELIPETIDDLYAIYRILKPGDRVRASTKRRIRKDSEDSRADSGERVKLVLEIKVENISFGDNLSIKGPIVAGNENLISLGEYHTIALKEMEKVIIYKDHWNTSKKQIISDIEKESRLAKIVIITLDEGSVCVALVTQFAVKIVAEIDHSITRKFSDAKQHSSALGKFFQEVLEIIKEVHEQHNPQTIILAGPGFTPENFLDFVRKRDNSLAQKIQFVHANTGGRVGLHEVLSRNLPEKIADEQRVVYETRLLEEFFKRVGKDTNTVTYGYDNVKKALEMGAVDTLMISDDKLRIYDEKEREKVEQLIEFNRQMGGKTVFFSTQHETGEKLKSLGGIVALLRYSVEI